MQQWWPCDATRSCLPSAALLCLHWIYMANWIIRTRIIGRIICTMQICNVSPCALLIEPENKFAVNVDIYAKIKISAIINWIKCRRRTHGHLSSEIFMSPSNAIFWQCAAVPKTKLQAIRANKIPIHKIQQLHTDTGKQTINAIMCQVAVVDDGELALEEEKKKK